MKKIFMVLAFVIGVIGFSYAKDNPVVVIKTNMGDIYVELYPDKAPLTVKNFLTYVKEGFYNGTIFHRVVKGFVIQGGGFDKDLNYKKPTHPPVKNESNNGLSNVRGTIAMARTSDPHSANTQFFINLADNTYLDYGKNPQKWGYTVFGKVIKGMDVVDEIAEVPVVNIGWMMNVPVKPVIIEKIEVVKPAKK
ncbi:peptidylprolyl isomerase [Persephonella sp. KM09-Lau-8]|uniref:peptidylprolyl isomerase n=1 Tax=Persephonella sp. KM09-Lau-8 TaxID=1158345 RepID=UPI00068F75C9|nr:peptidylprolyl isomerase [Persephonella sp. KM09-Lau-8]